MTWAPPEEFEEYRIVRPLGAGAMGRVYLAHDTVLDRAVAIKFIGGSEIGAGARARFYAEARAIARVSHPNVVGIHRIGEVRRRPFLVSEYVRGAALDTIPKPIPWQRALAIGLGLARGLASAHRRDVLHRDVKPANVVLGDDGEPKLLDFGLAKLVEASSEPQPLVSPPRELAADETVSLPGRIGDSASGDAARLTAEGAIVGTPLYLAPERWRGEPASLRTDVYALGVVLYELIAGRAPHAGLDAAELALRVPADDPAPIASCASDLPSRFAELIDACVARDPARRPESGEAVRELLEAVLPRPSAPRGSPYRGLGAFEAEHRGEFFGRAEDARAILERLRTDTVVVVAGDSGAGKSSLCRAGVLPAIADHAFVGRRWRIATLVPGARPSATLDAVLASHAGDDGLVIFVDQLEELLTVADPREARDFAERLAELVVASSTRRLLASARSDFLGRLAALPGLGELLGPAVFLLGPLSARGRREAIVGPARALGYELDPAMIDELVATGHHLPLLQFTLAELWEARDEDARRISADALIRIGGVGGALARRADQVLTVLDETDRELAWRVLVRLVTAEGTRARLARDELVEAAADRGAVERVVERLVAARLLVIGGEHVEVIHEALFTAWPRFVEWRRAHDHGARMRDLHGEAARRWHQQHRPRGMLWRGEVLAEYRAWRRRWHEPATGVEAEFDRACEADARRTRRVRTSLLAIVLVTLSIGLGILYRSDRRATQERDVAEERRAEAERQRRMLYVGQGIQELSAGHAERALPFLVEALREGDVSPSVRLLIAEALRPLDRDIAIIREFPSGIAHLMWAPDGSGFAVMARDGTTLLYDPDGRRRSELRVAPLDHIKSMAFSPDGVRLATANGNVVDLWDVATGSRIAELRGHTAKVLDVQFAAGTELISTVALDGSARLWDARTGKPQRAVIAIDATIFGCATIDREGARIAIGATDGALRVFDTATGRELFRLAAAMAHDCAVAFVPGDRLVTAGSEVRLWDTRTRAPIALLAAMTPAPSISYVLRSFVISVAPDGSRLAVGGVDGLVRVWDARSGVLVHHLPGHVTAIRSLHISDDRTRLVTAGLDRTFRIWNLQSGTLETTLEAHTTSPSISSAMTLGAWFSPDATRLLTAVGSEVRIVRTSQTGIVRDIETPIQPASAVLSPDEHLLAVAGLVRGLEVWSLDRGVRVVEIAIPSGLWDVRWSTDGKELLVVGKAGVAQIHAATGGPPIKRLVGHDVTKDVYRGTYSPDGTRIVTAAADRTVRIWDATTGAQLRVLPHEDRVMVATWSPDGKVIASASWDRTLRLWDAATGNLLTTIADPALRFLDVAFSPDGRRLAASSHAGVVAIWDVATGRRTHDLIGHTGPTSTVAWSPDGAMIASSSSDSTVRIWDVETSRQLATRGHGGEALQVTWNRSATKLIVASPIPGVRIWEVGRDTHSITELTSLLHTRVQWKLVEGRLEFVELR